MKEALQEDEFTVLDSVKVEEVPTPRAAAKAHRLNEQQPSTTYLNPPQLGKIVWVIALSICTVVQQDDVLDAPFPVTSQEAKHYRLGRFWLARVRKSGDPYGVLVRARLVRDDLLNLVAFRG